MIFRKLALVIATAVFALNLSAQSSDFDGVWQLDFSQSHMSDGKPLNNNKQHVISIQHKADTIEWREQRITSDGQMLSHFASIVPDKGETGLIEWADGRLSADVLASLEQDGQNLVFRFKGPKFHGTRVMHLSADRKKITADIQAENEGAHFAWTEVWKKL